MYLKISTSSSNNFSKQRKWTKLWSSSLNISEMATCIWPPSIRKKSLYHFHPLSTRSLNYPSVKIHWMKYSMLHLQSRMRLKMHNQSKIMSVSHKLNDRYTPEQVLEPRQLHTERITHLIVWMKWYKRMRSWRRGKRCTKKRSNTRRIKLSCSRSHRLNSNETKLSSDRIRQISKISSLHVLKRCERTFWSEGPLVNQCQWIS